MRKPLTFMEDYPFVVKKGPEDGCYIINEKRFKEWAGRFAGDIFISNKDRITIEQSVKEINDTLYVSLNDFLLIKEVINKHTENKNIFILANFADTLSRQNTSQLHILLQILNKEREPKKLVADKMSDEFIFGDYQLFKYDINGIYILSLIKNNKTFLIGIHDSIMGPDFFWISFYDDIVDLTFTPSPYFSLEVSVPQAATLLNCSEKKIYILINNKKIKARYLNYNELCISIYELSKYIKDKYNPEEATILINKLYTYSNEKFKSIADNMIQEKGMPYPDTPENMAILIKENKRLKKDNQNLSEEIKEKRDSFNTKTRGKYIKATVEELMELFESHKPNMKDTDKPTMKDFVQRVQKRLGLQKGASIAMEIFKALPLKYRRGRGQGNSPNIAQPTEEDL